MRNRLVAWTSDDCRQARHSPSLVPRTAPGASKSQERRRRTYSNPNPRSWKSTTDDDIRQFASGYTAVQKKVLGVEARAEIAYGENVVFRVDDRWSLSGPVLALRRTVEVAGYAPSGFNSSIMLTVDPAVGWPDVSYMAPAALGGHRFWLPWVSANHLYGIVGLEEYDPTLYKKLSTRPAAVPTVVK